MSLQKWSRISSVPETSFVICTTSVHEAITTPETKCFCGSTYRRHSCNTRILAANHQQINCRDTCVLGRRLFSLCRIKTCATICLPRCLIASWCPFDCWLEIITRRRRLLPHVSWRSRVCCPVFGMSVILISYGCTFQYSCYSIYLSCPGRRNPNLFLQNRCLSEDIPPVAVAEDIILWCVLLPSLSWLASASFLFHYTFQYCLFQSIVPLNVIKYCSCWPHIAELI